jgi:hypothetical protein
VRPTPSAPPLSCAPVTVGRYTAWATLTRYTTRYLTLAYRDGYKHGARNQLGLVQGVLDDHGVPIKLALDPSLLADPDGL